MFYLPAGLKTDRLLELSEGEPKQASCSFRLR